MKRDKNRLNDLINEKLWNNDGDLTLGEIFRCGYEQGQRDAHWWISVDDPPEIKSNGFSDPVILKHRYGGMIVSQYTKRGWVRPGVGKTIGSEPGDEISYRLIEE